MQRWWIATAIVAWPFFVCAEEPTKADRIRATDLKKKGDTLVRDASFEEALAAYDESWSLVHDTAILYNRGRALQQLGRFPEAYDALEEFDRSASSELKARVPNLAKTMSEISANIAVVDIRCEIEGAAVLLRGRPIGTTPLGPIRANAGNAVIEATKEGFVPFQVDTTLGAGETTNVVITLHRPVVKQQDVPEPEVVPPPPPPERSSAWTITAVTFGGLGLASLGTGIAFLGVAIHQRDLANARCPMKACDADGLASVERARTFATISTGFVIGGIALLGASLTTFVITPKSAPVQAKLEVSPSSIAIGGVF